ncbi:MAG: aspartate kinase [Candidatus Aegiribacteria sp.]|nr:aspartate kinase [Candidatus Aegiribacteria sp.]
MSDLCVMKFGGTCLATEEDRRKSVELCIKELESYHRAVVVVSAMGRNGDPYSTDALLELVSSPIPREKSCLMACGEIISAAVFADMLRQKGISAKAVTGWNAGLRTDEQHCGADLESVEKEYLQTSLEGNDCVVVAGFQGMSRKGTISILRRGGSDITATAIAAALNADELMLFKMIDSVFTADPEKVPEAFEVDRISSEDLRQLAWQGAKVVHPRASEIAGDAGIRITVKSHRTGEPATEIEPFVIKSGMYITGVASGSDAVQFRIRTDSCASMHEFYSDVFGLVADAGVSMDMFSVFDAAAMFTVPLEDKEKVIEVLNRNNIDHETKSPCAKVSIVGAGMHGIKGVMAKFSSALDKAGIDMLQSVDSHATISALVLLRHRDEALRALHREFLEQ